MKKAMYILLFLTTIINSYSDQEFDVSPLGMNFNGIIVSGQNIIAYSDNGSYLMTKDKGISWEQHKILETGNIKLMLNYKDTLWGIIDKGFIVWSSDDGVSWNNHQVDIGEDDSFEYFTINDNNLYIRLRDQIMQLDRKYNILNTYADSLLYYEYEDMFGRACFKYIGISKGKLLVSVKDINNIHNSFIFTFDENLSLLEKIQLNQYLAVSEPDCPKLELTNILHYKGKDVYIINHLPYYSEDNFTKWAYIYDNPNTGRTPEDRKPYFCLSTYNITNDKIYFGVKDDFDAIPDIIDIGWGYNRVNTVGVYKYNPIMDSFAIIGSMFKNSYYTISEKDFWGDGYSTSLWHTGKFAVVDDSVFVWAGTNKALIQSRNGGKDWEAVSYAFRPKPRFILNDSIFYSINEYQREFYRSTNSGACFIPAYIDTAEFSQKFFNMSNTLLMYMNPDGKGFITAPAFMNKFLERNLNFAFTSDSGKSFKFVDRSEMYAIDQKSSYSNVINVDDEVIFSLNNNDSCKIYKLNYDTYEYSLLKAEYKTNIHYLLGDNFNNFIIFKNIFSEDEQEGSKFVVSVTNDSGKTYQELISFPQKLNIKQIYSHNMDSVFISSLNPNIVLLYDRINNTLEQIYENHSNSMNFLSIMHLGDNFFILGDDFILKNNREDLSQWQSMEWDFGTPRFNSVLSNGSIALVGFQDSLRPRRYYKFEINNQEPYNVIKNRTEEVKHFFATKPYPTPSENIAKVKVYWDDYYDIEAANKYVCDVSGSILKDNGNIDVIYQQQYKAELSWNCSKVKSGIYFLVIDHNGTLRSIPVIVLK